MPLKRCSSDGKTGWKYGDSGKCYVGEEGKKQAIRQGISIEGPQKFSEKMKSEGADVSDDDVAWTIAYLHDEGFHQSDILVVTANLLSIDGYAEEVTASNWYCPQPSEYVTLSEEQAREFQPQEYDVAKERPGLWENIRRKKERMGDRYKPAKPGDKDRPSPESYKKAQSAEYQGRKVTLNKPFRTPKGPKKFAVYVRDPKTKTIKIVRFGSPSMEIKRDDPERRKSFRARHRCDEKKPITSPGHWSCVMWTKKNVSDIT